MTGRPRRIPGGSQHTPHPTTHTPTPHRPHADGPDPSRRGGSGGRGRGVGVVVDGIDTMASRLTATRIRVERVGTMVRGVNLGPQSMGKIGSHFTGAVQNHVRAVAGHLTTTTRAIETAMRGTQATAHAYRNTDAAGATRLSGIDTTTRPPRTTTPGGTSTSGTTTATRPSAPPTPPGAPGGSSGGAGGPTPPGGPGGGRPPGGGGPGRRPTPPGGTPPRRPSWKETIQQNFTPAEQNQLRRALNKMAQDPSETGKVAGSGALTPKERELVARAQGLVKIEPDTPMRKVIPPGDVDKYLGGKYDSVGGFVSRAQDGGHLNTPDDIVRGNRLDYHNTPFKQGMSEVHVIEFPATDPGKYQIPFGAPQDLHTNLPEGSHAVRNATNDMLDAAKAAGLDPKSYGKFVADWPYSGIGVTADGNIGIPERRMPDRMPIPDGSVMYRYDASGNATVVAEYHKGLGWVRR